MNDFLKKLLRIIKKTDIRILEIKNRKLKLTLKRKVLVSQNLQKSKKPEKEIIFIQKSKFIGVLKKVLVSLGEKIKKNQPIAQIEILKVTHEVLSENDGIVKKILIKEGETVDFGKELFIIKIENNTS